jgi:succinyl-diaminopimelate desuccinylase
MTGGFFVFMKEEIIALTKQFIKIPYISGTGDFQKAFELLDLVKQQLPKYEYASFVSNGSPSLLFSNRNKDIRKFSIILNAHLDVVAANDNEFLPHIDDGKLYGRGAKDMKAAAAAMTLVFKELGKQLRYPLGLQIVTDEETGGQEGTDYQVKQQGVRADFVITGEGTDFRIINESKRKLLIKLIAQGKASHGAYPWLGDNAIWKLQQVIAAIFEKYPLPKEESQNTTINVTHIGTQNTILNTTPFHCEAVLDIRYIRKDSTIIEDIKELLPEGVTYEVIQHWTTHYTDPNNAYIQILQKEAQDILGGVLPLARAHGSSDMPFYTDVGCEGIEFGPIGGNHHGDNEWVSIKSLEDYYALLKQFLLTVDKAVATQQV